MGGGQSARDLPTQVQNLAHFQRAGMVQFVLESLSLDIFHHQIRQRLVLDAVDLHDVLVVDGRRRAGFSKEPLAGRRRGGQLRIHHLDGHGALELLIVGSEDEAKGSLTEHLDDLVMGQSPEQARFGGRSQEAQIGR